MQEDTQIIEDEELDEEELLRRMLEEESSESEESEEIPESEDEAKIQIWKWFFSIDFVLKVIIILGFILVLLPVSIKIFFMMFSFLGGGHNQLGGFFD